MKTKKKTKSPLITILIVFSVLALVGGIGAYGWGKNTGNRNLNVSELPLTVKTIHEETKLYSIKAEYPVFGNNLGILNLAIKNDISTRISEFKTQSAQNWQERKQFSQGETLGEFPENPFTFNLIWTPQQINKQYISFMEDIEWFTGGANVAEDRVTFNWNVEKNIPVTLGDLFPTTPDYLEQISSYVMKELPSYLSSDGNKPIPSSEMFKEGILPKPENFERFVFDDTMVTFHFPKYQVAPGSYGSQSIPMLRSVVK